MMFDVALHAFTTLFVVIDPLGLLPVLLALTRGRDAGYRRRMALRGTVIAGVVLLLFAVAGNALLALLGISLPAFRIAGGLLLMMIATEMVLERRVVRRAHSAEEVKDVGGAEDISVFPLAIPLLSGPGAITSILLLMGEHQGSLAAQATILVVLAAALGLSALIFLLADPLDRLLGPTITAVVSRLFGILLAALAVQYVSDGVLDLWLAVRATA